MSDKPAESPAQWIHFGGHPAFWTPLEMRGTFTLIRSETNLYKTSSTTGGADPTSNLDIL